MGPYSMEQAALFICFQDLKEDLRLQCRLGVIYRVNNPAPRGHLLCRCTYPVVPTIGFTKVNAVPSGHPWR